MLPFGCSHSSPMAFSSVVSVNHPLDLIPLDLYVLLYVQVPRTRIRMCGPVSGPSPPAAAFAAVRVGVTNKIRIILILNIQVPLPFVNTFSQVFAIRTNKPLILPHSAQRGAAPEKEKSTRMADTMCIGQARVSL